MDALDKLFLKVKKEQAPSQLTREIFQRASFKKTKTSFFSPWLFVSSLVAVVFILGGVAYNTYYRYSGIGNFASTSLPNNYIPKKNTENDKPAQIAKTSPRFSKPQSLPKSSSSKQGATYSATIKEPQTTSAPITSNNSLDSATQISKPYLDIKIDGSNNPPPVIFGSLLEISWTSAGLKNDSCFAYGQNVPLDDGRLWLDLPHGQKSNSSFRVYARRDKLGYVSSITLGVQCFDLSGNVIKDDITFQVIES